jgi:hypothetical protein
MAATALLGLTLAGAGCAVEPVAYPIVGPDGTRMLHVSCGPDEGRCFQLAGQNCPNGYDMYAVHPPNGETFLVRCHYAAQQVVTPSWQPPPRADAATANAGAPRVTVRPSSSREPSSWPPTGEPDTVSPWPTAGSKPSAAPAGSSAPPMSGLPGSPDDIGY